MKNINLTGKEFDKAKQYIDEYKAEYNEALSEKENKINFYFPLFLYDHNQYYRML